MIRNLNLKLKKDSYKTNQTKNIKKHSWKETKQIKSTQLILPIKQT